MKVTLLHGQIEGQQVTGGIGNWFVTLFAGLYDISEFNKKQNHT
jgi:hypothetical protein